MGSIDGIKYVDAEKPFKVFVGYYSHEDIAYQVCRYSLLKRSSIPVEVIPIKQSELREKKLYWRERENVESTEFSFTRFLTPYLANYEGWAVFVDCDVLYLGDIKELRDLADDYTLKQTEKMDGKVQTVYPRKNWSSMVLYNCVHPKNRVLTPELVSAQTGAYLHRFQWLDDKDIGSVSFVWNFLVGHNEVVDSNPAMHPKAIHYTRGGGHGSTTGRTASSETCGPQKRSTRRNTRKPKLSKEPISSIGFAHPAVVVVPISIFPAFVPRVFAI